MWFMHMSMWRHSDCGVVDTPAEAIFRGYEMAYEVSYDQNNKVDEVTTLKK
jgi:hypothetical protein